MGCILRERADRGEKGGGGGREGGKEGGKETKKNERGGEGRDDKKAN